MERQARADGIRSRTEFEDVMIDLKAVSKWHFVSTAEVIERVVIPHDNWRAVPQHDGWLVPEADYEVIWGRPN